MNHAISLERAIQLTTHYREHKDQIVNPEFAERNTLPLAETFDRAAFDRLLSQPGCTALRLYYGLNEDSQLRAIFVGVNEKDSDLLPADASATDGSIVEDGKVCPPNCGTDSPLNA
jgi:hypothetical protein